MLFLGKARNNRVRKSEERLRTVETLINDREYLNRILEQERIFKIAVHL